MTKEQRYRRKLKKTNPIKYKAQSLAATFRKLGHKEHKTTAQLIEEISRPINCPYCSKIVPVMELSVDHILPQARGGSNELNNLHYTCLSCNMTKGSLTDDEFKRLLVFLGNNPDLELIIKRRLRASGFMYH